MKERKETMQYTIGDNLFYKDKNSLSARKHWFSEYVLVSLPSLIL